MALRCSRSALTVGLSVPPRIYIEALAKGGIVVTYHLPSATVTQFGSQTPIAWQRGSTKSSGS